MGIFFVFLGLTGSFLSFYPEIDRVLNPNLNISVVTIEQVSLDKVLDNAKKTHPNLFLHSIFIASDSHPFHQVWFTPSSADFSQMWEVMVHPHTAEVIGHRQAVPVYEFSKENIVNTIYTLHLLMFVGDYSYIFLGLLGIFLLINLILGLGLWWPRLRNFLTVVTIKSQTSLYRRFFDLHRVFGFYGLILLSVVAFSGVYLSLPSQVGSLMGVELLKAPIRTDSEKLSSSHLIPISNVIEIAKEGVPSESKIKSVWMPNSETNSWRVTFSIPGYIGASGGYWIVFVDNRTGKVAQISDYESASTAKKFIDWQLPLHSGKALGLLGRALIFLGGLLPLFLFLTGLYIWYKKRKSRSHINQIL